MTLCAEVRKHIKMDKIFTKTLKNLTLGTFKPSKPSPSELIFKNWDLSFFLLYDLKLHGKKIEKTDDQEILHCRQMGKRTKPNCWDTPAKKGIQLIFASHS